MSGADRQVVWKEKFSGERVHNLELVQSIGVCQAVHGLSVQLQDLVACAKERDCAVALYLLCLGVAGAQGGAGLQPLRPRFSFTSICL